MFTDTASVVDRPARVRASVSNGTRLLEGVDGRSASARRFRDLVASLTAELGGADGLGGAARSTVRQAVAIMLRAEQLQAAIVKGESVDNDALIRLSGESRRLLASLRRYAPKTPAPSMRESFASEAGDAA